MEQENRTQTVNNQSQPVNTMQSPSMENQPQPMQMGDNTNAGVQPQSVNTAAITAQQERNRNIRLSFFKNLAIPSILYALIYTFCIYENLAGITMPVWVIATAAYACYGIKTAGLKLKKSSIFSIAVMVLLGVSTCLTGNRYIIILNYIGFFLMLVAMLLHNFYQDREWDLGKYLLEILVAVCGAIGCIPDPFTDGSVYLQNQKRNGKKNTNGAYILLGILIAVPCVLVIGAMLMSADMVFEHLIDTAFANFRFPDKILKVIIMLCFGFFSSYCGVRYIAKHTRKEQVLDRRKGEPILAIIVTGAVSVMYLIFCGIQVVYLFMGNGLLPEGVTYAEYARAGFFQLLFICLMNLVVVLAIKKFFQENVILNLVLLVISICTYVMIASSAFRMLMYIDVYNLTFLRIFVLVALLTLAFVMAGVTIYIFKNKFPLFGYGLVVVSVIYVCFSFAHVDYFIADYNLSRINLETVNDHYLNSDLDYISELSTDAASVIASYLEKHPDMKQAVLAYYDKNSEMYLVWNNDIYWFTDYMMMNNQAMCQQGIRTYNLSHRNAGQVLAEYLEVKYEEVRDVR